MTKKYDVVSLTAACVDVQVNVDDAVLEKYKIAKGLGTPVTPETRANLMKEGKSLRSAGSPGGNVAAGIAQRGGSVALIGKIANDDHGGFFAARMQSHGVDYTPVLSANPETTTTNLVVLTTPDKERSFAVINGASLELAPEDIDSNLVAKAKVTYVDSYLWQSQSGIDAVHHAAAETKKAGGKVAISLNDATTVGKNRGAFLALAEAHGDILLGDRREFSVLFGTTSLEETARAAAAIGVTASVTAGKEGAYILHESTITHIPTKPVPQIVDTNGAGDQFAAGFIYGIAQGKSPADAGHQGALWASEVIQHMGAEPQAGKKAAPAAPAIAPKRRIA